MTTNKQAQKMLRKLEDTFEIPNLYSNENTRYTTEFTLTFYYKDGELEVPEQTYTNLQQAQAVAKEWYDQDQKNILFAEITLETTMWLWNSTYQEWDSPETVGEVIVAYYKKEN